MLNFQFWHSIYIVQHFEKKKYDHDAFYRLENQMKNDDIRV